MADWTNIPNSSLEPDAPARSIDAFAFRDNPIAIAEGAPGAPRIQNAGIGQNQISANRVNSISAGSSIRYLDSSTDETLNDTFITVASVIFMNSGSVRVSFDQMSVSNNASCIAEVRKNGALVQSFSTTSSDWVSRSVDTSISRGDRVWIRFRRSEPAAADLPLIAGIRNKQYRTSGGDIWPLPSEYFVFGNPA